VVSIAATGGAPTPVTSLQPGELFHAGPWFLPDGRHFLFAAIRSNPGESIAYIGDVDSKTQRAALAGNGAPVFAPPGYVLFARDRTLMAQPFDGTAGRTMGDPVAIVPDQVASAGPTLLSVSQNGVLVYVSGTTGLGTATHQLTSFDKSGKAGETVGELGLLQNPAISPDGTRVAFARRETDATGRSDIWLHDLARGHTYRFTLPNSSTRSTPPLGSLRGLSTAVWSSDGKYVGFFSRPTGGGSIIYQRATSGRAQDEILDDDNRVKRLVDWSHDGRYLVEESLDPQEGGYRIWVKPLFGDRKPYPYLNTQFREIDAKLSPNGQWLAYVSDESKRNEVFVTTFPNPGTRVMISISGGDRPVWSRDGKFLYFIGADREMMAVDMKPRDKSGYGTPTPLFNVRIEPQSSFDVAKDGRFLILVPVGQGSATTINVVINWQARFKK
jgi:hypothetical protein